MDWALREGRAGWAQGRETGQAKGENWAGVLGKGLESWVLLSWAGGFGFSWSLGLGWVKGLGPLSFLILILTQTNLFEFKQNLNSTTQCTQANKINAPA